MIGTCENSFSKEVIVQERHNRFISYYIANCVFTGNIVNT
jgi:hypothetical protein